MSVVFLSTASRSILCMVRLIAFRIQDWHAREWILDRCIACFDWCFECGPQWSVLRTTRLIALYLDRLFSCTFGGQFHFFSAHMDWQPYFSCQFPPLHRSSFFNCTARMLVFLYKSNRFICLQIGIHIAKVSHRGFRTGFTPRDF